MISLNLKDKLFKFSNYFYDQWSYDSYDDSVPSWYPHGIIQTVLSVSIEYYMMVLLSNGRFKQNVCQTFTHLPLDRTVRDLSCDSRPTLWQFHEWRIRTPDSRDVRKSQRDEFQAKMLPKLKILRFRFRSS